MEKKKRKMTMLTRFITILLSLTLIISCLTGCGDSEQPGEVDGSSTEVSSQPTTSPSQDASQSTGVSTALDEAFNGDEDFEPIWAGTQFYNGEEVVIQRRENGSEDEKTGQNIYLKDSKGISKRIISGVPKAYTGTWFYTYEGYCLTTLDNGLVRFDADGTEKFNLIVENGVSGMVQLDDGTIVLLMRDTENVFRLAVLDPEEGTYEKVPGGGLGKDKRLYISASAEGVVVLNRDGFWNANLETGELTSRMPITEYDYTVAYNIKAFRMIGGGSVRMLYQNSNEVLFPIDIEKYKTVVEVLTPTIDGFQEWLNCFNNHNEMYYAVLVPFESEALDEDTEKKLFNILESGAGADVVFGDCFDSVLAAMESGYLENLSPYMERDGVYEEDYFPGTFDDFKVDGQIYGAYVVTGTSGWSFSEEVLGSRNVPDLEGLINALLSYTELAALYREAPANLKYFLSASESLAGTVDWESMTCDFNSNLFASILEVSKLYSRKGNELPLVSEAQGTSMFYSFENEEQLKLAKQVYVGYLFDDGAYPVATAYNAFHINNHSSDKEGAWALIEFLLSEEFQIQNDLYVNEKVWATREETDRIPDVRRFMPVNVYAFDEVVEIEMEETAIVVFERPDWTIKVYKAGETKDKWLGDDGYRALHNLTEADAEEMLERMYQARPLPTKTLELQEIIYEEAAFYFNGERSLGDTCDAIQKRAQEYLDGLK